MSIAILFHFLCTQHVSDINISIIRSLRLCCWITTSVVLYSVRCVLEASAWNTDTTQIQPHQISNTQRTKNKTTDVVIQQHSRKLLMMDILMSETCWVHKKWNKIASDIKLVFYSSRIIGNYSNQQMHKKTTKIHTQRIKWQRVSGSGQHFQGISKYKGLEAPTQQSLYFIN